MLAFYINLDKRTDRRAFMEAQLAELGMNVERLQATTPDMIVDEDLAPLSMAQIGENLSPPEIATLISHFRAWKRMLAEGSRRVLVLEDDVRLSPLLPSFLAALEAENRDIGVLRLETRMSRVLLHARAEPAPLGISLRLPLSYEAGSGAYVISADCALRILASPKRFTLPIDDLLFSLSSPFRDPGRLRAAVPALAVCRYEITPEFSVPTSILVSDSQAGREIRYASMANRKKPKGLRKLRREILRVGRQVIDAREMVWRRMRARSMIVPFADGEAIAPPSAVPQRG